MRTHAVLATLALAAALGCTSSSPTPDQVRHDAAAATSTVVRDTKAAAEGIRDGVHEAASGATSPERGPAGHPVNINTGSKLNLMTLPGVTSGLAERIIAHRPYGRTSDLIGRRIVSSDEYDKIAPRITTD